jgi:hypothetical protein
VWGGPTSMHDHVCFASSKSNLETAKEITPTVAHFIWLPAPQGGRV